MRAGRFAKDDKIRTRKPSFSSSGSSFRGRSSERCEQERQRQNRSALLFTKAKPASGFRASLLAVTLCPSASAWAFPHRPRRTMAKQAAAVRGVQPAGREFKRRNVSM
ncbi:hypothetical protein SRHO_G00318840 [Serrasalmus rhombeus]